MAAGCSGRSAVMPSGSVYDGSSGIVLCRRWLDEPELSALECEAVVRVFYSVPSVDGAYTACLRPDGRLSLAVAEAYGSSPPVVRTEAVIDNAQARGAPAVFDALRGYVELQPLENPRVLQLDGKSCYVETLLHGTYSLRSGGDGSELVRACKTFVRVFSSLKRGREVDL